MAENMEKGPVRTSFFPVSPLNVPTKPFLLFSHAPPQLKTVSPFSQHSSATCNVAYAPNIMVLTLMRGY